MATEKQVKGVLIPRHDTAINWAKAVNFVPKKGELIIFDADAASAKYTIANVSNRTMKNADNTTGTLTVCNPSTQVRIKIGNGNLNVNLLPFIKTDITAEDLADYYTKDEIDSVLSNLNDDIVVSTTEPIVTGETIWLQPITTDTGSVAYIIETGWLEDSYTKLYYEKWDNGLIKFYGKRQEYTWDTTSYITVPSDLCIEFISHNITVCNLSDYNGKVSVIQTGDGVDGPNAMASYKFVFDTTTSTTIPFKTSHAITGRWK